MDERDIERGYANFHRQLNHVLRQGDVRAFKAHVARHPSQAGRLTHCLGLNNQLAEVEMYKAILVRSALKDLHHNAFKWLKERGIEPPTQKPIKKGRRGKKPFQKKGKTKYDRK